MSELNGQSVEGEKLLDSSKSAEEELQLKEVVDDQCVEKKSLVELEPVDSWKFVYIIMVLNGIGTLMPWNMFINANEYFANKLNVTSSTGESGEEYATLYLNWVGITAQIPNLTLSAVNMFYQKKGKTNMTRRMVLAIMTMVTCFVVTVILAMLNTREWPVAFFWLTMAVVVVLNMATGIYQNNVYGMAACLPMKYTNAVVIGSNFSGTLVAAMAILTTLVAPNLRIMAIYYFVAAIFVLLVVFDLFFVLPLIKFYRYYKMRAEVVVVTEKQGAPSRPPFLQVFKKCWVHHLSVWHVFFVTLACFPAINANILPSKDFPVQNPWYMLVFCFLFFNLFALLGNIMASFVQKPGPRWVWIPILARTLFIPLFMLCNFAPDARRFPVLLPWDALNIVAMVLFAWSSGYFSSLCMMYAPGNVENQHKGTAGMMAAFFLILGIFTGVLASMGFVAITRVS